MCIKAYYGTRRGGSGSRSIKTAEEAEKILRGGYGVTEVRLEDENGDIVGRRELHDGLDRGKWFWWYDADAFGGTQ